MYDNGEAFAVDLHRYRGDFQVIVDQLRSSGRVRTPFTDHALIRVRPYQDFVRWARQQKFDDRHWTEGIHALVEQGRLPKVVVEEPPRGVPIYTSTGIHEYLDEAGITKSEVFRAGFERAVQEIAEAIQGGQDIPPLVVEHGKPVDGRHRALAALSLDLKAAPVLEIAETF